MGKSGGNIASGDPQSNRLTLTGKERHCHTRATLSDRSKAMVFGLPLLRRTNTLAGRNRCCSAIALPRRALLLRCRALLPDIPPPAKPILVADESFIASMEDSFDDDDIDDYKWVDHVTVC